MKNKTGRRNFIKNLSAGSLAATAIPSSLFAKERQEFFEQNNNDQQSSSKHDYNGTYTGEYLTRVAFPIGGIGAGMFCMEGTGAISHMSVRNKPDVFNEPGMFAAICIKGLKNGAKSLEGPVPAWKKFGEGGLLLCTWPKGGKLSLPFVYNDEVWTGIEHQVASHLILMGHVKEGLEILRASRDRYDGRIRNPFNEYECGHWYARALSSYGYLQALTGVRFDAVEKTLYIDSKIGDFTSFLSTETGFGTVSLKNNKASLNVVYGKIPADKVIVSGKISSMNKT